MIYKEINFNTVILQKALKISGYFLNKTELNI